MSGASKAEVRESERTAGENLEEKYASKACQQLVKHVSSKMGVCVYNTYIYI